MRLSDPYRGRRYQAKKLKEMLRERTQQTGGKSTPARIGDTKDPYLRGRTSDPFSSAHVPRKK